MLWWHFFGIEIVSDLNRARVGGGGRGRRLIMTTGAPNPEPIIRFALVPEPIGYS